MEPNNFLADKVNVRRPKFFHVGIVNQRCDVIDDRVEPNVNDVSRVVGHGNSPVKRRARNAQVFKSLLDEINHVVAARSRDDKFRMIFDMFQKRVGIFRQPEEIRFLGNFFNGAVTIGTTAVFVELQFRPIRFAGRAIKSGVFAFVNVAVRLNAFKNFLHNFFVTRLTRANKIVIRDVELLPKLLEVGDNRVDIFKRSFSLSLRGTLNFLPVFV